MSEPLKAEARRLRVETRMSIAQLKEHFGVSRDTITGWLTGLPNPEWTARPQAKDELRAEAVELRKGGCSVPDIARRLGVAKSTAFLWTKGMPLDHTPEQLEARKQRHMEHMREVRWEPHRRERDATRAAVNAAEIDWVGDLSDREVLLLGSIAYWCEGAKEKLWRKNDCTLTFINSDEALILLFIRFIELLGVDRSLLHYRVSIHVSADVEAATQSWAKAVGVPREEFQKPTLKKHNPKTVRYNIDVTYRGCLIVYVPKSSRLYWKIEGIMAGVARSGGLEGGR